MARMTVEAHEVREGDVILAESPRYHGPTFTVDTVTPTPYPPNVRIVGHYGRNGEHPATLASVPPAKPYLIEREA